MNLLARTPDKFYELAIVDPPYGIGETGKRSHGVYKVKNKINEFGVVQKKKDGNRRGNRTMVGKKYKSFAGNDKTTPPPEYFKEVFRVSKNQIIWGGNYFTENLPPSMGWVFWDKDNHGDFSDGELAFTSFDRKLTKVLYVWNGFRQGKNTGSLDVKGSCFAQGNKDDLEMRIHPTQKPVALYKWLLQNYAKQGDKILDTHLGSGSIAIACLDMGFELTGCELDSEYFGKMQQRINAFMAQTKLL